MVAEGHIYKTPRPCCGLQKPLGTKGAGVFLITRVIFPCLALNNVNEEKHNVLHGQHKCS